MSVDITELRPTTIVGIKRLSTRLQRARGLDRQAAMNEAAGQAGYENYAHALRVIQSQPAPRRYEVFVTCYWYDTVSSGAGRETLRVELAKPLAQLLQPSDLPKNRQLFPFQQRASDHLQCRDLRRTSTEARRTAAGAARALMFMDATGLKPINRGMVRDRKWSDATPLPGIDHASTWLDPISGSRVYLDEPYPDTLQRHVVAREAWLQRCGIVGARPTWQGLYAPQVGAEMHVFTVDPAVLARVVAAINGIKSCPTEVTWTGGSAPYRPAWRSPHEVQADKPPRPPRNPLLSRESATTVPYSLVFNLGSRRPKVRMTLDAHQELGQLLKDSIAATYYRAGAVNRLCRVRSELDDWLQCEYRPDELSQERFSSMYYADLHGTTLPRRPSIAHRDAVVLKIERAIQIISTNYPDCPPRRAMLKQLNLARGSVVAWPTNGLVNAA